MKAQKLLPLLEWSSEVIRIGQEEGLSTEQITESIKIFSKERGWEDSQINKVLRHNGVLKPIRRHVINVICPKCNYVGRFNGFYPTSNRKASNVHYYVAHETWSRNREGTWGKRGDRKYRRCYLFDIFKKPEYLHKIINQIFPIGDD